MSFMNSSVLGEETSNTTEETKMELSPVELKSMFVVSHVRNRYARTEVTNTYTNPNQSAQEAIFSIVLPETAFIAEFIMEINGKKYEAYVKEKEEAKQEYNEAVSRGRGAAHVEANSRDSNKFNVAVNVEPNNDITFLLIYEELLVRKHSKYELVINLHPRQYISDLRVDVYINETKPVINIDTPAFRSGNEINNEVSKNQFATTKKEDDGTIVVSFHPNIEQQKEMAQALTNKDKNLGFCGQFVVEYDVERDPQGGEVLVNDGYFVHFFAPSDLQPIPKHVIFVLDVSGSMSGIKIQQLKEAMKVILEELNPGDYFNLIKFHTDVHVLYPNNTWQQVEIPEESKLPESFAANKENITKIQKIVDHMTDEDCTNIYDALIVALRLTSKGISHLKTIDNKHKLQPIIVFLTDGQPNTSESDPEEIIKMVEKKKDPANKSVIFTLAFGDDADNDFLKKLAIQNSGFLRIIYEAADASLQLQDFYKQISSPLLTNVNFKYSDEVTNLTKHSFDILFNGAEFVVTGKIDTIVDDFVFVEASTLNGTNEFCPVIIATETKPENKKKYGNLERLWAYMSIKQLLDKKFEVEQNATEVEKAIEESAEKQALKLALKYSFVTPITSLVVVKPDVEPTEEHLTVSRSSEEVCPMYSEVDDNIMFGAPPSFEESSEAFMCAYIPRSPSYSKRRVKKRKTCCASTEEIFSVESESDEEEIVLLNVQTNCSVVNHMAKTTEIRKYYNTDNRSHQFSFIVVLPDSAILTHLEMEDVTGELHDEAKANTAFQNAISNNLNAVVMTHENLNEFIITLYMEPLREIHITLKYQQCLEKKNGKYEACVNFKETYSGDIGIDFEIKETTPIISADTIIKSGDDIIRNEYAFIDKIGKNDICVNFHPSVTEYDEMITKLNHKDVDFSGQFIVEYTTEADQTSEDTVEEQLPILKPNMCLLAIETKN